MIKHDHAGPLWTRWGTVTIGVSSISATRGPNVNVEFVLVSNVSIGVGYIRLVTLSPSADTVTLADATQGKKISEYGDYVPCSNLQDLYFHGQTGTETVTINYGQP